MTTPRHWTALDGLRGVAAVVVLLYHFGSPLGTGGYLGVDTFFVISGFVVTLALRRSDARGRSRKEFFLRRAARLLPNLIAFLFVVFVWDCVREQRLLTSQNAAVLEGLTQTYNLIASKGIATIHLWSLSLEWQFYAVLPLVLPILCVAGARIGARRAALIALASLALRPVLAHMLDVSYTHIYVWPFTRMDGVMFGVAVALLVEGKLPLRNKAVQAGAAAVLACLMLFAPDWYVTRGVSLNFIMPVAGICAAIIVWGIASGTFFPRLQEWLSSAPMRYLGDRSYSIYLWHYFVGVAVLTGREGFMGPRMFVTEIAVSLAVAIVFYEAIEQPARSYFNRLIEARFAEPSRELALPQPRLPEAPAPALARRRAV